MTDLTMGQRIAECRKKRGFSQEALGEKTGVSRQAISKWESDGAVPEIDKLICLSRLFGVSMGWLLGVEDQPETPSDELTDTQLKMVEEIVKRYQPEPMEKKFPWILSALLLGAGLLIAISLFFNMSGTSTDYSSQISALQSNYAQIQGQLSILNSRIDELSQITENSANLLSNYNFELTSLDAQARVSFRGMAKSHRADETATISISRAGAPTEQFTCRWEDSCWKTEDILLPIADGYEYCFILTCSDGTQQFQTLDSGHFQSLAASTEIQCEVSNPPQLDWYLDELRVTELYGDASMPALFVGPDAPYWEEISFILYVDGVETDRCPMLGEEDWEPYQEYHSHFFVGADLMDIPAPYEGMQIEITYYARISSGQTREISAGAWAVQNHKLVETTPAQ